MNLLQQFLRRGFTQSIPVLGGAPNEDEFYSLNGQDDLVGFFKQTDEAFTMEEAGYLETITLYITSDKAQFLSKPAKNDQLTYDGNIYTLRTIEEDQAAYILGFKLVGPASVSNHTWNTIGMAWDDITEDWNFYN